MDMAYACIVDSIGESMQQRQPLLLLLKRRDGLLLSMARMKLD